MVRVVISGYYGFHNLGDEAVLAGLVRSLRLAAGGRVSQVIERNEIQVFPKIEEAEENMENKGNEDYQRKQNIEGNGEETGREIEVEITVLSNQPADTAVQYGVEAVSRNDWPAVYRAVSRADLLISGGGSLLQDVTSWRTVPYYLSQVLLAQLLGKKTIFYAQGIGPVRRKSLKLLIRLVGKRTNQITVRDYRSRELLAGLGLERERIAVTADPVFALPTPRVKRGSGAGEKEDGLSLLGVSVRPWEGNSYLPAVAAAVDRLARLTGCRVMIIPMHLQEDLAVSARLQGMLEHDSVLIEKSMSPEEMLASYASLDYLIGVRLHSLIFAAHSLVPFTALSYDPKVQGFLEMLDMEPPLEIGSLSAELLVESCHSGWLQREKVREKLGEKRGFFREKALYNGRMALELVRRRV